MICVVTCLACQHEGEGKRISPSARQYLDSALNIMQHHSINRAKLDWNTIRNQALNRADTARSPRDTYESIRLALKLLGDRHSFFLPPERREWLRKRTVSEQLLPTSKEIAPNVGYVSIPGFGGGERAQWDSFATNLQQQIEFMNSKELAGWVVDLRKNTGGNMWPMLAGISALLGADTVGAFVSPTGEKHYWVCRAGQTESCGTKAPPSVLGDRNLRLAVLIGPSTMSSGEAIAVAFQGRNDTRFFGLHSRGLSTANEEFLLADSASLILTISSFADGLGRVYANGVSPDEKVESSNSGEDLVLVAALRWLTSE